MDALSLKVRVSLPGGWKMLKSGCGEYTGIVEMKMGVGESTPGWEQLVPTIGPWGFFLYFYFCVCGDGDQSQRLTHYRQMFYH